MGDNWNSQGRLSDSIGGRPVFLPLYFLSSVGISERLSFLSRLLLCAQPEGYKTEHNITKTPLGGLEVHTGFQLSLQRTRTIWILSGAGLEFMLLECSKPTG